MKSLEQRNAAIAESYKTGAKLAELAALHGLSASQVKSICSALGATNKWRGEQTRKKKDLILRLVAEGYKTMEVARLSMVSRDWVRKVKRDAVANK